VRSWTTKNKVKAKAEHITRSVGRSSGLNDTTKSAQESSNHLEDVWCVY